MQLITLDAFTLHSLGLAGATCRVKLPFAGLGSPDVRVDSYNRPGEHGLTVAHTLYGQRLLTLQGIIKGADVPGYLANRQALENAVSLQLDSNNVPIARTLAFTDLAGGQYQVSVVTQKFLCEQENPTFASWHLELLATRYVIEGQAQQSATLTLPVAGGVTYPVTYPVRYGAASGGTVTATNLGTAPAKPIIVINGPCLNPSIYNDLTGEKLAFSLTLVAGDTLTVNCAARTAVQGASTSRMANLATGSKFWALQPGANTLRFTADAYDVGSATVSYRAAFIGV